jgi:signal transduction histidine kinase
MKSDRQGTGAKSPDAVSSHRHKTRPTRDLKRLKNLTQSCFRLPKPGASIHKLGLEIWISLQSAPAVRFLWRIVILMAGLAPAISLVSSPGHKMGTQGCRCASARRAVKACAASLLLIVAGPWADSAVRAQDAPRRVLMLHAFNYTFPATTLVADAARKRLTERSATRIEIDADFLDLARVTEPGHELRMAEFLRQKYARTPPDVVMTLGSAALPFMLKHRDTFAPNVPVVFTAISPQNYSGLRVPPDVTGIITEFDLNKTLALAERLQPNARRLFVIAGGGDTDRRWQATARAAVEGRERKFETTYLFELSYDKLVAELSAVPHDAIVILLTVFADSEGKTFIPAEAAAALSALSPAPVYAPYDTFLGKGVVGGFVGTFESVGVAAADLALEIMAGRDPATLPPRTNPGQAYRVDYRAMQRWKLHEGDLPADTLVLFKEPSVWDQYRWPAMTALAVVLFQAGLIGWLLLERQRRRVAELDSRQRLLEVIHLNRSATAGALSASVAHELNQPLGAILSNAEAAEVLLTVNPPDLQLLKEILADIRRDDQRAGEIIRHLRGMLRKSEVDLKEFDLSDTIDTAVHILEPEAIKRGIALSTVHGQGALPVRADQIHLQQVIVNLAANGMDAMIDCGPGNRRLAFQTALVGDSEVEVSVADSGTGIPSDKLKDVFQTFFTTKPQGTGLGLSIARTIIETYGGRIWAENRPGGGAVFRFTLPLAQARAA